MTMDKLKYKSPPTLTQITSNSPPNHKCPLTLPVSMDTITHAYVQRYSAVSREKWRSLNPVCTQYRGHKCEYNAKMYHQSSTTMLHAEQAKI